MTVRARAIAQQYAMGFRLADEKVWRLPLEDELREKMNSAIADLHNSSPSRFAQAGTAAAYLSFFVGSDAPRKMPTIPWIHLDIAGTSTSEGDTDWDGLFPKGQSAGVSAPSAA